MWSSHAWRRIMETPFWQYLRPIRKSDKNDVYWKRKLRFAEFSHSVILTDCVLVLCFIGLAKGPENCAFHIIANVNRKAPLSANQGRHYSSNEHRTIFSQRDFWSEFLPLIIFHWTFAIVTPTWFMPKVALWWRVLNHIVDNIYWQSDWCRLRSLQRKSSLVQKYYCHEYPTNQGIENGRGLPNLGPK